MSFIIESGWYLLAGKKDETLKNTFSNYVDGSFNILYAFVAKNNNINNPYIAATKSPGNFTINDWENIDNFDLSLNHNIGVWANIEIINNSNIHAIVRLNGKELSIQLTDNFLQSQGVSELYLYQINFLFSEENNLLPKHVGVSDIYILKKTEESESKRKFISVDIAATLADGAVPVELDIALTNNITVIHNNFNITGEFNIDPNYLFRTNKLNDFSQIDTVPLVDINYSNIRVINLNL